MQIYTARSQIRKRYPRPVVAIGIFDGLHRGHQAVIRRAVSRAAKIKGTPVVMTFSPHPVHVLNPRAFCPLIISLPHRLQLIAAMGVRVCWVVAFTRRFARLDPEAFIRRYLAEPLAPKEIIVGEDFRFGQQRRASAAVLQERGGMFGCEVRRLPVGSGIKAISSSRIRRAIAIGDLRRAAWLLGRPFSILGEVVHGDSRGSSLGYPTANLHPERQLLPPSGVYIVEAKVGNNHYPAMANLGRRPSFKKMARVNLEVHIFNLRRDLYGRRILVKFLKKIRDERVFRSQAELVQQIRADEEQARRWFRRHS